MGVAVGGEGAAAGHLGEDKAMMSTQHWQA